MGLKIYLSGPITGRDRSQVEQHFRHQAHILRERGHIPLVPLNVKPQCDGCVYDTRTGSRTEHSWSCYLRWDLAELLRCDAIMLLTDWATSHGARLELQVAAACGLRVFTSLSEVPIERTRPVMPDWSRSTRVQTVDTHGRT